MSFTDSLFIQFKQSSQREFVDLVCLGKKQKKLVNDNLTFLPPKLCSAPLTQPQHLLGEALSQCEGTEQFREQHQE